MNLVVVSNRVSRGKANEPMTGGLAAALLPVVEKSGAIWVGSSGRVRDGAQKEPFAEIEALGAGALAMLDLPAAHYGGYYEGFANSALWPALHSRTDLIRAIAGRLSQLSRSQRLHGARAAALSESRTPRSGFRIIISWRSARSCAISASRSRSASSCIRRGRRAPSSAACRIIANWSRRCWPTI